MRCSSIEASGDVRRPVRPTGRSTPTARAPGPADDEPGRGAGDRGSATVEFVLLAALLLIPVIYFLVLTSLIQSAAYASVAAADQAAKAMVTAADDDAAAQRAQDVVALTLADYDITSGQQQTAVSCSSTPCLEPGSLVTVDVRIRVPVPLLPQGLGWNATAAAVSSTSQQLVPRFG